MTKTRFAARQNTELGLRRSEKVMGWIAGFLLFLLIRPYFVWMFIGIENWYAIFPLYIVMLLNAKIVSSDIAYLVMFSLLTIFAGLCEGANIVGLTFGVFLASLFLASKHFLTYVYRRFWLIYCTMMALSILVYLLLLIGIHVPGIFIPPLNELKNYYYMAYPFLVVPDGDLTSRFCAFLDEPGAVGTMAFFFLFIEKCNFRKIGNLIILFSGLLSMSLFLYGALSLYLFYIMFWENSIKVNRAAILFFFIIGIIFVATNETTNEKIVQRLSVEDASDDRLFAGDNRASADLKDYVSNIRGSTAYFFGTNNKNIREMAQGSASIQNVIVRYGVVVFLFYLLFYQLYSTHCIKQRKNVILFMVFLLMSLYNRPYIFNQAYVFLFNIAVFAYSAKLRPLIEHNKK